jgi:transketolase
MALTMSAPDKLVIDTIRTLSMDAVQAANSGHPGTPMALAPVAYTIWQQFLRYDPELPNWPDRDRFVLSVGHASMLVYSLLHLSKVKQFDHHGKPTGEYSVPLDHIKKFRQLGFRTPGHPESFLTTGVETTTGPLGQGLANSVGMAVASKWQAAHFNKPGFEMFNYRVYALCGDGCMMEGISGEAASLAAHLKLNNLCWIYDDNNITIDGKTLLAFSEDVGKRFEGYGWNVLHVADANDTVALAAAYKQFEATADKPTLIIVKSVIGFGAPTKAGSETAHGAPLGPDEIKGAKKSYGWPEDSQFLVPEEAYTTFANGMGARGKDLRTKWESLCVEYKKAHPELGLELETMLNGDVPANWDKEMPVFPADAKGLATRESSAKAIQAVGKGVPWFVGGAADLAKSTLTTMKFDGAGDFQAASSGGRNMHFGIREHAMAAILNGMALSKLRAFGSGFLIFSDYARAAIRLASINEVPTVHVFTHDSIGVGEDGPTHQPIEQVPSLRMIPGMRVFRPGDANEVSECWRIIMGLKNNPALIVLSRQAIPTFDRTKFAPVEGVRHGAYILSEAAGGKPQVILIATGTEVSLAVSAQEKLAAEGIAARVVSMPCCEIFDLQDEAYRESVLPKSITARVAVEAAATQGWYKYVGLTGSVVGMTSFGASAPFKDLYNHFGLTVESVVKEAKKQIA